jgi:hypothetical protein
MHDLCLSKSQESILAAVSELRNIAHSMMPLPSQLKLHYGKEQVEVIMNIVGNIIRGQVSGDIAKQMSEKFGKILKDRQSIVINVMTPRLLNPSIMFYSEMTYRCCIQLAVFLAF